MPQRPLMAQQVCFRTLKKVLHCGSFFTRILFPSVPGLITMSDEEAQEHFDNFFEDVFAECEDKVR